MGSGDPYGRQLDGMGAGISSLSKICLVEPYTSEKKSELNGQLGKDEKKSSPESKKARGGENTPEAHIDYTFVGLGIENDEVDVAGNCGNMSSAIGPYAYNARLLPRQMYVKADGEVTVKIRNTNTGKFIDSTFKVVRRQAAVTGNYTIDGVTGKGSVVKLDFRNPYGSKTGKTLPTGKRVDTIAGYKVTCVDGANPAVFIRASDVGVDGTVLPDDFSKLSDKLALLERVRKSAAVAMGIAKTEDDVPRTIPKIGIVSMSATHTVLSGATLKTSQTDLVVRFISDTQPHRAVPLTVALTTAVAARIPGTIVEQLLAPDPVVKDAITIGHASGRIQVNATMHPKNSLIPLSATVFRTAKRIFLGHVYWVPESNPILSTRTLERHSLGMAFVNESRNQTRIDLDETIVREVEEVRNTGEHIAPSLNVDQGGLDFDRPSQHTDSKGNEDYVLHSSLEPYEASLRKFEPAPRLQTTPPESPPKDLAQHQNHGTTTEHALAQTPPPPSSGKTTQPQSLSQFSDTGDTSRTSVEGTSHVEDSQAQGKKPGSPSSSLGPNSKTEGDARVADIVATTSISIPTYPGLNKHLLASQIASVKQQIAALEQHLSSLTASQSLETDSSSPTPSSSFVSLTGRRRAPSGSKNHSIKRSSSAQDVANRKENSKKQISGNRKKSENVKIGRGW
jgi:2-methylaconitate cis-trans-isomerase PrpF